MKKLDIFTGDYKKEKNINTQEGAMQFILLGAFLLFFGLLWKMMPIGIYPDSGSYIAMQEGREPFYPLFLALFRVIFHEKDTIVWLAASGQLESEKAMELIRSWPALHVSILVQGILAAFACWYLTKAVQKIFGLNAIYTILVAGCTLIPYVLTPLASASRMVLNNAVLTEGLCFPMSTLFVAFLLQGLLTEKKKTYYGLAFLMAFLLIITRNQMLVFFAAWCAVLLFEAMRQKNWRIFCVMICGVLLFFAGKNSVTKIYYSIAHSGYSGVNTGSYNVLTTLLYLSDETKEKVLTDPDQRMLFLDMHKQMEEREMTLKDAPAGVLGHAYHYEDCYDLIGFEIQQPCLFRYAERPGTAEGSELDEVVRVTTQMSKELLPELIGEYMNNYLATVVSGLTRSISASGVLMGIYSLIMYSIALLLVVYLFHKNRQSKAAYLMLLALLLICANVFGTAIMIMCLSRYMIYNTALFYIAGLMCLREMMEQIRNHKILSNAIK